MKTTTHTPGPWKVMACPDHGGKHPYHDSRYIVTEGAQVDWNHDNTEWALESGICLCTMRDVHPANARLIAAAPELLEALEALLEQADLGEVDEETALVVEQARAAIAKANGGGL